MKKRTALEVTTRRIIPMQPLPPYGMELVIDLHDCDHTLFTRKAIKEYFLRLCTQLDMQRGPLHFWDYPNLKEKAKQPSHLKGTSAIQFIYTSNIVVHTLDDLHRVYINIFSCKEFSVSSAVEFSNNYFGAGWCGHHSYERS